MQHIYEYVEETSNQCQLSLTDLMDKVQGSYCPHIQTVEAQLLNKCGDGIIIVISPNKVPIVSAIEILSDSWYSNRKSSGGRVIDSIGAIIADDLRAYRSYHQIMQSLGKLVTGGGKKDLQVSFQSPRLNHQHKTQLLNQFLGCRGACICCQAGLICSILCVNCSGACDNGCQQDQHEEEEAFG
ncbi:hypothetical protein PR048_005133 [Dryococelus australis]|uniref:Uncharacterized protein n=1 Tax=Dryococelus australis TaxID=614101 RepID=A0ABQ9I7U3_9NEOP|nr:hypothetical protein PR048_005133 [Dryococelus australis]